ncbi:MAG: hypothetical protein U0531_01150 [Dehalococcoidia bacterium]
MLARRLPLRVAYLFAALAGTAVWLLWREKRENAIHNMRFVFDDRAAATRAARRSFINYARYIVDFFRTPALNAEQILARLSFDRWEEIDAAFAEGKGDLYLLPLRQLGHGRRRARGAWLPDQRPCRRRGQQPDERRGHAGAAHAR